MVRRLLLIATLALALPACDGAPERAETAGSPDPSPTQASPEPSAVPEEASPTPAVEAPAPIVWVAVEDAGEVVAVDLADRRVVARVVVPAGPHNLAVAEDGTVAVADTPAGIVSLIRGDRVIQVELGGRPHDVKWAGDLLVVANEGAGRLDLVSRRGAKRGEIALDAAPHDLAVAEDGRTAWVSLDGSDRIAVVDLERRSVRTFATGRRPHDLLFDPRGRGWVTDWGGVVHVLSDDGDLVRTLELGSEAHHLTFTPDGTEAWITDHGARRVFVVATRGLRVLASLRIPGAPHHVAVTPDGRWAAVADHDRGTLVVFDVRKRRRVAVIEVGPGPHGVGTVPRAGLTQT